MKTDRRRLIWIAALAGVLTCTAFALQFAFWNVGQEFGAYGQYHRVLRVVRSMDDFRIMHHAVQRKLELGSLSRVEQFSLRLRDGEGRVAVVLFQKNTPEMAQEDAEVLRIIIRDKFREAVAQGRH